MTLPEAKRDAAGIITNCMKFNAFLGTDCRTKAFTWYNEVYHNNPEQYNVQKESFAEGGGCRSCNKRVADGIRRFLGVPTYT